MTARQLFQISSEALAITGPAEWDSPDDPSQRDALTYIDDEIDQDGPLWSLASTHGDNADYLPIDTQMAARLIEGHLRRWLLDGAWQVQVTVLKTKPRWRLVDGLSIADGGGDRLDENYPQGPDELAVLCQSVSVVARA